MNSELPNPYPEYFDRLTNVHFNDTIYNFSRVMHNYFINSNIILSNQIDPYFHNNLSSNEILNENTINNNNDYIINNNDYDDIIDNILIIRQIFDMNDDFNMDNDLVNNDIDENNLHQQNPIQLIPIELNELEQMHQNNDCCSICLEQYVMSEDECSNVCKIGCGHHFHKSCVGNWFGSHNTCPLCRTQL